MDSSRSIDAFFPLIPRIIFPFFFLERPDQKRITLGEGEQRRGVDLIITGGRSIAGVVLDPQGRPVSGAEVTAGPETPDGRAFRPGMHPRVFTGADGTFA